MKALVMSITLLALLVGLVTTAAAQPFESPILISPVATPDSRHQAIVLPAASPRAAVSLTAVQLTVEQLTDLLRQVYGVTFQLAKP